MKALELAEWARWSALSEQHLHYIDLASKPDGAIYAERAYTGVRFVTGFANRFLNALVALYGEWRDIATAPKNGTRIVLYQPDGQWQSTASNRREWIAIGSWHQPGNPTVAGFWVGVGGVIDSYRPTHWMPLPDGPKVQR